MAPMSIYIGGLNADILYEDLRKEFCRFGNLTKIWVARNPPGFAFINFENDDDASDAIKKMNGTVLKGSKIRVEPSYGNKRGRDCGNRGGIDGGRDFRGVCERSFVNDFRCSSKGRGIDFLRGGLTYGSCFDGDSGFHSKTPIDHRCAWKPVGVLDCAEFVKDSEDSSTYKSVGKKRKYSCIENISSVSIQKKKTYVEKSNENVENINSLPEEILIQIFQYFRRDEFNCIARVCKSWYKITSYPVLWKKVNVLFHESKTPDKVASSFSENLPTYVTHLKLDFQTPVWKDSLEFEGFCMTLRKRCPSLKVLILHYVNFSISLQAAIDLCSHYLQNVEVLSIRRSIFTNYSVKAEYGIHSKIKLLDLNLILGFGDYMIHSFSKMSSLKNLCLPGIDVNKSWFEDDPSFLNNLEVLNLQHTNTHSSTFRIIKTHALKLTELYLCGTCVQDNDFILSNLMLCQLKTICLRKCSLTCEGIVTLIRSCHSLQNVYVDHEMAESYAQHPFVFANKCKLKIVKSANECSHFVKDYLCEK